MAGQNEQGQDLGLALLVLGAVLVLVGVRAIVARRILRGRSMTEHVTGKRAVVWGWVYLVAGGISLIWSLKLLLA